jgi:type VI secretion system secreted protein VgrG
MAVIVSGRQADFVFQSDGGPPDKLRVAGFTGVEGISMPYKFLIRIASTDPAVSFDAVVGKPGLLTIHSSEGSSKRHVHGVVVRFEQVSRGMKFSMYEADLVPSLWLMSYRSRSRIFQEMTVPDILKKVLVDGGLASDRMTFSLRGSYPAREYCVQYRESDFSFVSRLMEEEGIYYFFEHTSSGHKMVMMDSSDTKPIPGKDKVTFRAGTGSLEMKEEHVHAFRYSQEVRSGKAVLRDFNYRKPAVDLTASAQADKEVDLEVYDHPGEYVEAADGTRYAKVRLEEMRATKGLGRGQSSCRAFVPGFRMTLQEHGRSDFNKEYLLLEVRHRAEQPMVLEGEAPGDIAVSYENDFECILATVPYRPERVTPRPVVRGSQTATVVGPKDEKVYMDDQGRAKVLFHWDREGAEAEKKDSSKGTASCWVRVSQGYAGATHGIQFPPLVGDEVVVDFLEGDPDQPLIVGRVYNAVNMPPLKPDERIQNVILTPYQHKMLFDDKTAGIMLTTAAAQTLFMQDGNDDNKDYGNTVKVSTKDGHFLQLAKGDKHKGFFLQTEAKHVVEMRDDPEPGIFIVDKEGKLFIQLDTQNKTINVVNDDQKEINIKCAGGTVKVEAGEIILDATNKVTIKGGSEISLGAPNIKIEGQSKIDAKAPQVAIEGQAKLEAKGAQASLEGTGKLDVKGAMATFEGSGMATVKAGGIMTIQGALVKIN